MQENFKKLAKTKLRSKKHPLTDAELSKAIRLRHSGILGMCAFILAHPYDIPEDIPIIFDYLSPHLIDPEPIPVKLHFIYKNKILKRDILCRK